MASLSITQNATGLGSTITSNNVATGSLGVDVDEAIAIAASDLDINVNFPVADMTGVVILSDQDLTLETNDGTVPVDTVVLVAGVTVIWFGSGAAPFLTDVTSIFATNASGSIANLQLKVVYDGTP